MVHVQLQSLGLSVLILGHKVASTFVHYKKSHSFTVGKNDRGSIRSHSLVMS